MLEAVQSFKMAMQAHGPQPPESIQPGKLHRFPGSGNGRGDDAGWCKLFDDLRGGVYGDFSTGLDGHWQLETGHAYSAEERPAFKQRCEAERKAREAETLRQQEAAAKHAVEILVAAAGDPSRHPYAVKKAVPFGTRVKRGAWPQRGWTDALLVPVYGEDGKVWTLEAVNVDGEKDYLKGGRKCGCFHMALLNMLWDGGTHTIGLRTSESFTVHGARLTVALQIQEATLRTFFDKSGGLARGTGFLARFLVAWPESTQGFRPFTDPPDTWPKLAAFHRRIADILNTPAPISQQGGLEPAMLGIHAGSEGRMDSLPRHD